MYQIISKFVTNTTFMNYPVRFSKSLNVWTVESVRSQTVCSSPNSPTFADLKSPLKTKIVELQILTTNRNTAEKLPQHLKYSQKWLNNILEIYKECGAQRFQAIKVRINKLL